MYILIAAALAIGLFITAAPAHKVSAATTTPTAEWATVSTPSTTSWVLAPGSVIYDYALASDGSVAYAVVQAYAENQTAYTSRLLKSTTSGATWTDLTDTLSKQVTKDGYKLSEILQVATDGMDPSFLAVALVANSEVYVYFSTDGGSTFVSAGQVADGSAVFSGTAPSYGVTQLAVSPAVSGVRDIAIGGQDNSGNAVVFRSRVTVSSESYSTWIDTTGGAHVYTGWDVAAASITSTWVTDVIFSPNWPTDHAILVTTVANVTAGTNSAVYLESGTWGTTSSGWNAAGGFAKAVPVLQNTGIATALNYFSTNFNPGLVAGIALPSNYDGSSSTTRYAWVWVNYYSGSPLTPTGKIVMVMDGTPTVINQQVPNSPWLTNVSYLGTIAEGKAIAGVWGNGGEGYATPCQGVAVYHNDTVANMLICCTPWQAACKLPTGVAGMAVSYVDANYPAGQGTNPNKAYAVALYGQPAPEVGFVSYDESAWSVAYFDSDFTVWNQLSLVDTQITKITDVAVSPVCNKIFLATVGPSATYCASVWVDGTTSLPEAPEYAGYWVRTWCGKLGADQVGLLRLPPASVETTGDNVYLVDYGTNTIYYNSMETWDCWKTGASTVTDIVDLAVKDAGDIYALGATGDVAMSNDYGKAVSWTTPVASGVAAGYTIALHGNDILVGGQNGDVAYSSDGGTTFTLLDTTTPITGLVTVAFDTYFDTNNVIYAAVDGGTPLETGGIYDWVIGTSTSWNNLGADNHAYTGLVLSNINGNPFTSAATGGVLYASYVTSNSTGVARCLTPLAGKVSCSACRALWDYLTYGLDTGVMLEMEPEALKACGCTTPDTYTNLYAIDSGSSYNMVKGKPGTVWTFEDCFAKQNVTLVSPASGYVVGTSSCGCCNVPFTIKWDQLCDACSYDIQFALDSGFTQPVELTPQAGSSLPPTITGPYSGIDGTYYTVTPQSGANPTEFLGCYFQPQTTYYWRMRAAGTGNQVIHSWWSTAQSFTVSPTASAAAIDLVAPTPGATDVAVSNVAFSWHILATADSFDFVLSKNADLSSPILNKTGLHSTATSYTGTALSNDTPYYWQVTAYNNGAEISKSAIGTFRTVAATPPPVTPTPTPTPVWVWVVIAIGAVLVIVVIVLIFRTRRV